jgi:hypothetical protein
VATPRQVVAKAVTWPSSPTSASSQSLSGETYSSAQLTKCATVPPGAVKETWNAAAPPGDHDPLSSGPVSAVTPVPAEAGAVAVLIRAPPRGR